MALAPFSTAASTSKASFAWNTVLADVGAATGSATSSSGSRTKTRFVTRTVTKTVSVTVTPAESRSLNNGFKISRHNRREVPQEHSHEQFLTTVRASLNLNNPAGIKDVVFGLLGNAAATTGANGLDPDSTADQAFTIAKAAGDVASQTAALVFAALERNTGGGAAAINKASTLGLAIQIAAVGGDPQIALKAGTFAPGQASDSTGKGNSCDDQNDATGCIFTQNLIVEDATAAEITAAVASGKATTFTGTLGGAAPEVTAGGRGFIVSGSDDFVNSAAALKRSCDIQHNACANAANSGGGFTVAECDAQDTACTAAA
ncbi:hypothetical protein RQP46_005059 [Phenoliferia psychrophenolica]